MKYGQLLTYNEFLENFQVPIKPKKYAVVFDSVTQNLPSETGFKKV